MTDSQPDSTSGISTGGGGTVFEQHVDAVLLALLLMRGVPPVLLDCQVTEVQLQTNPDWHTDDFLIVGTRSGASQRRLMGQVKLGLEVGKNDDFVEVVVDAWRDFRGTQFVADSDQFAIVTQRGTKMLLAHFVGLLNCARASQDSVDFATRLASMNDRVGRYYLTVVEIVRDHEGTATDQDVLRFLRTLHVLNFDLMSSTGQTEAWIKAHLAFTASGEGRLETATSTWRALVEQAALGMTAKRAFRLSDLPPELRAAHGATPDRDQEVLRSLTEHSSFVLDAIRSDIEGAQAPRAPLVSSLLDRLGEHQIVLVAGPSGAGKSALAKLALAPLQRDCFVFAFRAERFAAPNLDDALNAAGLPLSDELRRVLAAQPRKILLIESGEKLLESTTRGAFADLVQLVRRDPSWQMVVTCRDYSAESIRASLLDGARELVGAVTVPPLTHEERDQMAKGSPPLARLVAVPALRELLRNPFILRMASRMSWKEGQSPPQSERAFRAQFWREIVRAEDMQSDGLPARREKSMIDIAVLRARALRPFVDCSGLDLAAIVKLKKDSLVSSPPRFDLLAAPGHDVLEDWALLQWVEARAEECGHSLTDMAKAIGDYPAMRRTYRRFLLDLVKDDVERASQYFESVCVLDSALPRRFQDDTLVALLLSDHAQALLDRHQERLLSNRELLRRLVFLTRVACVGTPEWLEVEPETPMLVPRGASWPALLGLLAKRLDSFSESDAGLLLGFVEDWSKGASFYVPNPPGARDAIQIAHWLLKWFDGYRTEDDMERTLTVIAKVPLADRERFISLLQLTEPDEDADDEA